MDAKKHFWVDYLACLIFGAVIMPLWRYCCGANYCEFEIMSFFVAVAIFTGVHVVCFWGLGLFLKEKEKRLFFLYCAWCFFWFSLPIAMQLTSFVKRKVPFFYSCRWVLMIVLFLTTLLGAVGITKGRRRCSVTMPGKFSYVLFFILGFQFVGKVLCTYYSYRGCDRNGVKIAGQFPNIYHILCDAHPSLKGFSQIGGDLKPFYSELEKLGFVTYPESRSVFPGTSTSVPSMLFMDDKVHTTIGNSPVLKILERAYTIRLYASYYEVCLFRCSECGFILSKLSVISSLLS